MKEQDSAESNLEVRGRRRCAGASSGRRRGDDHRLTQEILRVPEQRICCAQRTKYESISQSPLYREVIP
jgi:hypothetical protein